MTIFNKILTPLALQHYELIRAGQKINETVQGGRIWLKRLEDGRYDSVVMKMVDRHNELDGEPYLPIGVPARYHFNREYPDVILMSRPRWDKTGSGFGSYGTYFEGISTIRPAYNKTSEKIPEFQLTDTFFPAGMPELPEAITTKRRRVHHKPNYTHTTSWFLECGFESLDSCFLGLLFNHQAIIKNTKRYGTCLRFVGGDYEVLRPVEAERLRTYREHMKAQEKG